VTSGLFPASADWTATSSNTSITGDAGVISLAAESDAAADDGVWWDAAVTNFLVGHADGTFHPSSAFADATLQAMTECILPRELGTSLTQTGTNIYGGDQISLRTREQPAAACGGPLERRRRRRRVQCRSQRRRRHQRFDASGARAVRLLSA
jgi:hypothetical protein